MNQTVLDLKVQTIKTTQSEGNVDIKTRKSNRSLGKRTDATAHRRLAGTEVEIEKWVPQSMMMLDLRLQA